MSDAFKAMADFLGQSGVHAVQALRQSTALVEVLIAKGVVTREEVDEQMRSTQALANNLEELARKMGSSDVDH